MEEYALPCREAQDEFIERKSRFIGHIVTVSTEAEALAFLKRIREAHRDATHNVYAYRIYNGGLCRHSDDGEPSGTAGLPLLEVFTRQGVYDFCCVATRYFGGILLGAGGLTRAYAKCGTVALAASGLGVMRAYAQGRMRCAYAQFDMLKRVLEDAGAEMEDAVFTDTVEMLFSLQEAGWEALCERLSAVSAGSVVPERLGTVSRLAKIQD